MPATQQNREVEIVTTLGPDELMLRDMTCTEALGRLYTIDLELISENDSIRFEDLLGEKVSIRLDLTSETKRYFHGHITRFSQSSYQGEFSVYQATVQPWLWFLTRTSDCRIFQRKTVPDIIKKVFRDLGYTDFDEKLSGSYRKWDYCVQYRETDFNFVSRLMEQEGIYYYFEHEKDKHTLVLSDSYGSHESFSDYETIAYYPPDESAVRDEEHISSWYLSKQVQPGAYVLNEFDFERPKANLEVNATIGQGHSAADFELYDYPGEYVESDDGDNYSKIRIQELNTQYEQAEARSDARGIAVGCLFSLSEYPREDQNREYLIVSATHSIHSDSFGTGSGGTIAYSNSFSTIEGQTVYRNTRSTPKPIMQGPQTAIIVGTDSDEIHTDKYGRVKLQFHWDRYGKADENSSCWVRVSQNRAGKGWGEMYIPHVGQEVIVSFLEGDPDRPIVIGRVFNADNMPPLELPANKTMTTMRDHGGSEMVMEGKAGEQRITMFSPSGDARFSMGSGFNPKPGFHWNTADNWVAEVGTDKQTSVKGTRVTTIEGDSEETINGQYKFTVNNIGEMEVTGNYDETIGGNRKIRITGEKDEKVGVKKYWNFGSETKGVVGAYQETFIGAKTSESLAVTHELFVGAKLATNAAADISIATGIKIEKSNVKKLLESPMLVSKAKVSYTVESARIELIGTADITLEVGGSRIDIGADGINIVAPKISIKADSEISTVGTPVINGPATKLNLKSIKTS